MTNHLYKLWSSLIKFAVLTKLILFGNSSKPIPWANRLVITIENLFYQQIHLNKILKDNNNLPLNSKLCIEMDFHQLWFKDWCQKINMNPKNLHRKLWEHVVISQALSEREILKPGNKGLGFAVGNEPLPALFASFQCNIVATDIGINTQEAKLWGTSGEHLNNINNLRRNDICKSDIFNKFVSYRPVDMNQIPSDLKDFDFVWSTCAFEHLGSISNGMDFVINSMGCLKNGGWAVHTTEFNLTSNVNTFESENLVLFRRKDIEHLISILHEKGYFVEELDTSVGLTKNDYFVNQPPYRKKIHLKLRVDNYVTTSLILIIRK